MAYQLSPGVAWSEIDLTTIVPAAATTEGAFAGNFSWGPVNEIRTISNELDLVRWFGKPDQSNFTSFFTAANFLAYGNNLKLVRSISTGSNNATTGDVALFIKNRDQYDHQYALTENGNNAPSIHGMFAAKWAGELGNSLRIGVWAGQASNDWDKWEYKSKFDKITGTSRWADVKGANTALDEMHVVVIDRFGKFSDGVANSVLEVFPFLSKASDAINDDGSSNFYVNVINDQSEYVWALNYPTTDGGNTSILDTSANWGRPLVYSNTVSGLTELTTYDQANVSYNLNFSGGFSLNAASGTLQTSYGLFLDPELVDISLVMTGDMAKADSKWVLENIVEKRRDCVVFISPESDDCVNQPGTEQDKIIETIKTYNSSSYGIFDGNWKKQFDKYNNVYRWVPLNGDIAGLCARTDTDRDPWFSPAGFNRGQIKNVVKLAWNPTKANRDELYKNNINPVVSFRGEGVVLYGDKTMQTKPSAFDRINVRRLFLVLEKSITKAAKYSLFEFNDEFTRAQFVALVEPYLRDVKGRRGIYDFKVVCDETNNTPEVIDRNEFRGDIYIKPARSINFIQLNFVAVRTGVAFSEIVGKF